MSQDSSSSDSSSGYARFAGNTRLRELGCYVDLGGTRFEVPRLEVEANVRWELLTQAIDGVYPHGPRGSERLVVDSMSYRQRRGCRTAKIRYYTTQIMDIYGSWVTTDVTRARSRLHRNTVVAQDTYPLIRI